MMSDDSYTKMCLALPDKFFDGWLWQAGDRFIELSSKKIYTTGNAVFSEYKLPGKILQCYYDDTEWMKEGEIVPLPSQEQLQNRVMEKRSLSPFCLQQYFYSWLDYESLGKNNSDDWFFVPLVCRWLEYTVYSELSLRWNGEKWLSR